MNLRCRFFAPALVAPCLWLAGCSAAADDFDDVAPAQEALAEEAEGADVAGDDIGEADGRGALREAGVTAAGDQCTISGFPKPWGTRRWGSTSVSLYSSADNLCWFTTVTSTGRADLCAWVDLPIIGNRGKVCASNAFSVTSHNAFGVGVPTARGSVYGFPIWFQP